MCTYTIRSARNFVTEYPGMIKSESQAAVSILFLVWLTTTAKRLLLSLSLSLSKCVCFFSFYSFLFSRNIRYWCDRCRSYIISFADIFHITKGKCHKDEEKSTRLGKEASATFNDIRSFCMQTMKNEMKKKWKWNTQWEIKYLNFMHRKQRL